MSNDMFKIDRLISSFGAGGYARANRFSVEFSMPRGIGTAGVFTNSNSEAANINGVESELNRNGNINVMCHTCTLPSRDIQPAELKQYGPPHRMPLTSAYMPISFSFYSGADLAVRRYFETWQTAVVNISSNTMNFYNEYTSDIKIKVYDIEGNCNYSVDIYEAWPSSVGLIDYAYSNTDTPQSIMVAMQFRYWQSNHDDTRVTRTV